MNQQVISKENLEKTLWDVANCFRVIDNQLVAFIFVFFLKFISDNRVHYKLELEEKYDFDYIAVFYHEKVGPEHISELISILEYRLGLQTDVLSELIKSLKFLEDSQETKVILQEFRQVNLDVKKYESTLVPLEVVESIIMKYCLSKSRYLSESITESTLAELMIALAEIVDGMSIYDPACGFGIIFSHLVRTKRVSLYGQDVTLVAAGIATMLQLIGFNRGFKIFRGDSLTEPCVRYKFIPKTFDRILSTPPFGLFHATLAHQLEADWFEFEISKSSKNDLIFIQHALALLSQQGKAVILIPLGALFRRGQEAVLRKGMLQKNYIETVIELPSGLLAGTGVFAAIIILNKAKIDDQIFFIDAKVGSGFFEKEGKTNLCLMQVGLERLTKIVKERQRIKGFAEIVSVKDVLENDGNIVPSSYIRNVSVNETGNINLTQKIDFNERGMKELQRLEKEMKDVLKHLGV